jgi:hypothetical protein
MSVGSRAVITAASRPPTATRLSSHLPFGVREVGGQDVYFGIHVRNDNRERTPPLVVFKAVCGLGDEGEPIATVMVPEED